MPLVMIIFDHLFKPIPTHKSGRVKIRLGTVNNLADYAKKNIYLKKLKNIWSTIWMGGGRCLYFRVWIRILTRVFTWLELKLQIPNGSAEPFHVSSRRVQASEPRCRTFNRQNGDPHSTVGTATWYILATCRTTNRFSAAHKNGLTKRTSFHVTNGINQESTDFAMNGATTFYRNIISTWQWCEN